MNSFASRLQKTACIGGGLDSYREIKCPGGGIGRRAGLKHLWETVPVRLRSWVQCLKASKFQVLNFNLNSQELGFLFF